MADKKHKRPKGPVIKPLQNKPYTPSEKPPLVDSGTRQLDLGQIVVTAAYHTKSRRAPNLVAMSILMELQQPGAKHIQIGNTLFVLHEAEEDPRKVIFRALNADTANRYARNAYEFAAWAYEQGYDIAATQFSDPALLRLFRFVSKNPPNQNMGYNAIQTRGGDYLVMIKLGKPRE